MADKSPKKQLPKDDEVNLVEAEELPEDSKDYQSSELSCSIPGSLDSASVIDERFEASSLSAESRSTVSPAGVTTKLRPEACSYQTPESPVSVRTRSSKSCSPLSRRSTRSGYGGSDSTSGIDLRYGSPERASSSAESRSCGSATVAIPKIFRSSPDASRTRDSESVETDPVEGSPQGPSPTLRRRSHSFSSIGSKIKYAAAAIKTSISPRFRRKDAATNSPTGDTIPLMMEENESGDGVEEPVESKQTLPGSQTSSSSTGDTLPSMLEESKSGVDVEEPVESKLRLSDSLTSSSTAGTQPSTVEEIESGVSVEELVESKLTLPDNQTEEKMETSPAREASDVSMEGACGRKIVEKEDVPTLLGNIIERQLSTDTSNEDSSLTEERRRKLSAAGTSELWKKIMWSAEGSPKSSLPGTGTTTTPADSLESLSVGDSEGVDSYEEAQSQGRRRQRDSSSLEEEEGDSEEFDGGPSKRPALERRDTEDDEGPSDQPMPLPTVERLI